MQSFIEKIEQYLRENYDSPKITTKVVPKIEVRTQKEKPSIIVTEAETVTVTETEKKTAPPAAPNPIQSLYTKIAPNLTIQPPPIDESAQRVKQSWKDKTHLPNVPIFIDESTKQHAPFLSNLASAIQATFVSSQIYDITVIEKENRWENIFKDSSIKFLLIPDVLLWKSPHLITYYREIPGQLLKKIAQFPLFILQDIDAFYKSPELKSSLWNVLSQNLQHLRR